MARRPVWTLRRRLVVGIVALLAAVSIIIGAVSTLQLLARSTDRGRSVVISRALTVALYVVVAVIGVAPERAGMAITSAPTRSRKASRPALSPRPR